MERPSKSTTYKAPEPEPSYTLWTDISFLGCVASGILLVVMVLALLSPETGIPKVREVIRIKNQLEQDVANLQTENERLLQEIEAMKTDPFCLEKIAREELNMALPGEFIYKFSE